MFTSGFRLWLKNVGCLSSLLRTLASRVHRVSRDVCISQSKGTLYASIHQVPTVKAANIMASNALVSLLVLSFIFWVALAHTCECKYNDDKFNLT